MIDPTIKLSVHPKTGEVRECRGLHALSLSTGFDAWVRVIVFRKCRRVYFRFYKPDGDYYFVSEDDKARSFDACYLAWEYLVKNKYCKKSWKVLYWCTDRIVTPLDVKL